MAFTVEIKNLGKIAGAPIVVGGLTVLAGPNATGKSFFSKALYSVFDAMNANHALMEIQGLVHPLQRSSWMLSISGFEKSPALVSMEAKCERLVGICAPLSGRGDEIATVEKARNDIVQVAGEIVSAYQEARPKMEKLVKSDTRPFDGDSLKSMDFNIDNLGKLTSRDSKDIVLSGFGRALLQNLRGNFQVSDLADLKKNPSKDALIDIEDVGVISIAANRIQHNVEPAGLAQLQEYSRVIYLESPMLWKLRSALKNNFPRFLMPDGMNLNIPKHFTDLDAALNDEYPGEIAFPGLLQQLTDEVIRGGVTLAESGEMVFGEQGQARPFPMQLTATGMVNLGILALLIEKKIIDKGAFLFIDEPEANLHPKWQVEMIRTLFELARGGVHVVIATHSPDIMERLSALVKENPGTEKMIALNHFSPNGVLNGKKDFSEKMEDIQRELTDAFSNSYMRNVQ